MVAWWHRAQLRASTTPNTRQLLSSTETIYIYASVQQFEPVQNWFIIPPLSLNWNLNLQFSLVQFRLCKPNHGSVQVQFRFELISELNFGSTTMVSNNGWLPLNNATHKLNVPRHMMNQRKLWQEIIQMRII